MNNPCTFNSKNPKYRALVLLSLSFWTACGGSSGNNNSGGGGTQNQAPILITSGDQQHAFSGGNLAFPIGVHAQDSSGAPIASLQITFTAAPGVTVFPTQVSTGPGGDARALVNLPDTPLSQFTITATSAKGGSAKFTEFTALRLLQEFGNATTSDSAVLKNGTIVAEGGLVGAVFGSDGMPQQYLGSNLKRIALPDFFSFGWGLNGTVGPDQKVYLYNSVYDGMFVLDSQMNVVRFVDFQSNSQLGPLAFDCFFAVAPNGNIFCDGNPVFVFDQNGFFLKSIDVQNGLFTLHSGIVTSNTGI